MTFEVGEPVQLRSGGAQMIVTEVGLNNDCVRCAWHNKTKDGFEDKTGVYPAAGLVKMPRRAIGVGVNRR